MQSRLFSRILFAIVAIICILVFVRISKQAATKVPLSEFLKEATSTPQVSTTTIEVQGISEPDTSYIDIRTSRGSIHAEVSSTSGERELGLSGRRSLPDDGGMLFVFDRPGAYPFWMKDMKIPLDLVWISAGKKVLSVTPGVSPDTYPQIFYPPAQISYVLELNSGGAEVWGIATGTQLVF
jgi:uncharacterized membrane protein (UPF0127 family)